MPEIGAELVHFAIRVATCSIPIQDRLHGHRVSQIMKAGTVAEPTRCLPFTKTDLMADLREVVPTIDCGQAPAAFVDEEGDGADTEDPAARGTQGTEPLCGACLDRNDAAVAILAVSHLQNCAVKIDISVIKSDRFADAKSRDGQHPEQCREVQSTQPTGRGKPRCLRHDRNDFVVGVGRNASAAALRLGACSACATTASRVSTVPGSRAARQSGSRLKVVWLSGQYQRAMRVPRGVLRA